MTTETTIAETVHRVVAAWKGDEPGSCGFECACGDTFDGFDSIADAEACHKPLKALPSTPVPQPTDPRAEYIAGLRAFADLLEQNPDLQLPYHGASTEILIFPAYGAQRAELVRWARLLPGRKEKQVRGNDFDLVAKLRGLKLQICCRREEVCEKRVIGTEPVTEMVPDPEALASVPLVERTTEREIVEWVCAPSILADQDQVDYLPDGA